MNTIRITLCAALCCAFGTAAFGALCTSVEAAEQGVPTETVRFDDLNLASPAGAKTLYQRIRGAARAVCERPRSTDPMMREAVHACIGKAIDDAVRQVNAPTLSALRFGGDIRLASK